jgi:hypothetical protein
MKAKLERSSTELSERLDECKTLLNTAIENADLDLMKKLRLEIRELPEQIVLKEIAELKNRIESINAQLEQNEDTKKLLREVIAQRKGELQAKLDECKPYYENLDKAAWQMSFANNEYSVLLVSRREAKARLFSLTDSLKEEV